MNIIWSDADIAETRRLAAEGMSAAEIGKTFSPPRSRNAVIGKCHRVKPPILLKGQSGVPPKPKAPKPERIIRVAKSKPLPPPKPAHHAIDEPDFDQAPPPADDAYEALPGTTPIPMTLTNEHTCKWPIGEKPTMFCGLPVDGKKPYCSVHSRRAFRLPLAPIFNGRKSL